MPDLRRWRITLEDGTYRSFGQREIRASRQRQKLTDPAHHRQRIPKILAQAA